MASHQHSVLGVSGWLNGKKINITGNTIENRVQDRVALEGSVRRRLHIQTIEHMNHPERSQKTVPLTSIQDMPGSVPKTIQELERYGEPRHRTHWWLITTCPSKKSPTTGIGIIGQGGYVVVRRPRGNSEPPLPCQKVSWFRYSSCINDLIKYSSQETCWKVSHLQYRQNTGIVPTWAYVVTRRTPRHSQSPILIQEVCWFRYPSCFNYIINYSS